MSRCLTSESERDRDKASMIPLPFPCHQPGSRRERSKYLPRDAKDEDGGGVRCDKEVPKSSAVGDIARRQVMQSPRNISTVGRGRGRGRV